MTAERVGADDLPIFAVAFTHRGRRARNEDAVCRLAIPGGGYLAIVCDGMGGHAGGAYASKTAIDGVTERIASGMDPVEAIKLVNAEIHAYAERDPSYHGMGTTLVMALVRDGHAFVYNVGDSRAYLLNQPGSCDAITRDHSFVAESVAAGEMSETEALSSRYKNALTRAIGTEPSVEVDRFGPFDLTNGAELLLCSDGFYKTVPTHRIPSLMRGSAKSAADDVVRAVLAAFTGGSDDNISLVVIGKGSTRVGHVARRLRALEAKLDGLSTREARALARSKARASSTPQWGRRVLRSFLALCLLGIGVWSLYSGFFAKTAQEATAAAPADARQEATSSPEKVLPETASVRRSISDVVGAIPDRSKSSVFADSAKGTDSTAKRAPRSTTKPSNNKCDDPANRMRPECQP